MGRADAIHGDEQAQDDTQDVADLVQVSKPAVSLAFNKPHKLSDETLNRILQAAADLGYSQDPAARMLRTRRTDSLGLLLPQEIDKVLENPYYPQFLQGIGQTCQREGYTLLLAPLLARIDAQGHSLLCCRRLHRLRPRVRPRRGGRTSPTRHPLRPGRQRTPRRGALGRDRRDREACAPLVAHLLQLGHRRIALVSFATDIAGGYRNWHGPALRRMQGAIAALAEYHLTPESDGMAVLEVPCTRDGGIEAFHQIWNTQTAPLPSSPSATSSP